MTKLPVLKIGDLEIFPPIIQGGMGIRISMSKLASAVANLGCVGTISGAIKSDKIKYRKGILKENAADVTALAYHIRKAKSISKGIIAVNLLVALTSYNALASTAIAEKADIIFSGAGLPLNLPELTAGSPIKIVPIVSSARVAELICKTWSRRYNRYPDAIVVEGPMAGGHLGFTYDELKNNTPVSPVEKLLTDVLAVASKYSKEYGAPIPVIAAGGIFDGKDMARMLQLGASGVQLSTRFVCTPECDASDAFKQAYIKAEEKDIMIIKSPVGMPGRAVRNEFLNKAERGEIKFKCDYLCLKSCSPAKSPYCIADALTNAAKGDLDNGFVFCGTNVHKVKRIQPLKEIVDEIVRDAEEILAVPKAV